MLELILYFGPVILVVLLVLLIITQGYVKAPPDHAYIISGLRKEPRVLVGRAGLKLPFFEQLDKLYLGQITVDIKTDEYIPTNDFINVMVDAVAKVRVADDPAMLKLAMRNFLNKNIYVHSAPFVAYFRVESAGTDCSLRYTFLR